MARIAINGFGRIGRLFFRKAFEAPGIEIVAINDLGDLENLEYLLKYDTIYGHYTKEVSSKDGNLFVDGHEVKVLQVKDPLQLPWKELEIDVVIEATGAFESFEKAKVHLAQGAKRVVISAPAKDDDTEDAKTVVMGVNPAELQGIQVTSNGSCTTNAVAPVVAILEEKIGIVKAMMNTVHAMTSTQNLTDGPTKGHDFRRGRAAAENIVPSSTGAAISVIRALPSLAGKFDGMAIRVPVATGSLADITFLAKRATTAEEVNGLFRAAAADPRWQGILAVVDDQIVSSDIVGEPYGAIVDLNFTKVVDGDLVRVLSWYDNEMGYVATLLRHVLAAATLL